MGEPWDPLAPFQNHRHLFGGYWGPLLGSSGWEGWPLQEDSYQSFDLQHHTGWKSGPLPVAVALKGIRQLYWTHKWMRVSTSTYLKVLEAFESLDDVCSSYTWEFRKRALLKAIGIHGSLATATQRIHGAISTALKVICERKLS